MQNDRWSCLVSRDLFLPTKYTFENNGMDRLQYDTKSFLMKKIDKE